MLFNRSMFNIAVNGFRDSGKNLSTAQAALDSAEVETLATCLGYIQQHAQIAALMNALKELVAKDATELKQLQQEIETMDRETAMQMLRGLIGGN